MNDPKIRAAGRTGLADVIAAAELALGAVIERARAPRSGWGAAIPVIGVNAVAFLGQMFYWRAHLPTLAEQVLVASVLESIAIFWAWQAHRARMANDSALRTQLAAYLTAAGVGVLNYTHFMLPGWRPTVAAVTFGGMSAISPWLWASYSRRENRDALKARGDIEDHAVRLGLTRWIWHAWRCLGVMRVATWEGITSPAEAIAAYEAWRAARPDRKDPGTSPRRREPRQDTESHRPDRASRARELAPATVPALARLSEAEQALALELSRSADPLPGQRELARDPRVRNRPHAARILEFARAGRNGHGSD